MDEEFELPVQYKDKVLLLPAKLQAWSYGHRILVEIDKQTVVFEPDEERNYRAVADISGKDIDIELITGVIHAIETAFR